MIKPPMITASPHTDGGILPPPNRDPLSGRVPGNGAIWVGILSEMSEFALFFVIYFLAKVHNPELFNIGPTQLNTTAGTLNTLVLIASSYFVAKAMSCIRRNELKRCEYWLWLAVGCAVAYLGIKWWEYEWNTAQGFDSETNAFFTIYYYMTFNHFLHVGWAGAAIVWVALRLRRGYYDADNHEGLEAVCVYWHMIDLAWILIFPLLYVMR